MKLVILFILSLITSSFGAEWVRKQDDLNYIPGDLRYYNRSACAKRSLYPTKSVFMLVDNVNIAKSVFRLSKRLGLDSKATTDLGIKKFRYSLTKILQLTAEKILKKELPLIPLKATGEMAELLSSCENDNCTALYQYLETNWLKSSQSHSGNLSSCRVVKKLSTLHSHLKVSKPDRVLLEEMAKETLQSKDIYQSCNDISEISEPEVALYQFDILVGNEFTSMGFDFWNTLKIYLSWAFRHAPEMEKLATPFDYLFKSANLEEMVLIFSNGCESIKPTSCSQNDLSLNNLSFLTQNAKDIEWNNLDMVKPVPEIEPNNLFSKPLPVTENDLLNLGNSESANEWVSNFRDNYIHVRGYNKIKAIRALNSLRLITDNLNSPGIMTRVSKDTNVLDQNRKQALYYLCSEYSLAANKDLMIIKKDLMRLREIKQLKSLVQNFNGDDIEQYWTLFETLAVEVNSFCKKLKQREIWDDSFELKKDGFAPWYRTLVYDKKFSFSEDPFISLPSSERPYLSLKSGETICADGLHCARQVLDSMMSLSAVSTSLSTLLPENGSVVSNNMANPYVSHLACGAYDPWQKKNQIIYNTIHDLVQTAVFGTLPTPVYIGATIDPKRVVSFQTLVKEGMVFYDPTFNTNRFKLTLLADLGPLVGVPCAVSISGARLNPFNYYMFDGISLNSCKERERNETVVGEGGESVTSESYYQACASCAINLSTVASSASNINPAFRISFFLIKGLVRLAQDLRDPHDLAKDWVVTPHKVSLSYRYHGKITKSCTRKLIKGEDCLPKSCESSVVSALTQKYKISPQRTDFSCMKGTGRLEVKECTDPIYVNFNQFNSSEMKLDTKCALKVRNI